MEKRFCFLVWFIFMFILLSINLKAQVTPEWVARYNGPGNGWDVANSIVVDNIGNVYVTGESDGSGTSTDYATIKYNSDGVQQWVATYNGTGGDHARSIAVDNEGNVYVTGSVYGINYSDYATIKYNSVGIQQWIATYNGPSNYQDYAFQIAVDNLGNIYVTGESDGSGTSYDCTTIKYDSAGAEQWVQRYNGPGSESSDSPASMVVDNLGNVYVTGYSGQDYATIKYNSSGVEQWVKNYNGTGNLGDNANSISVDNEGNVYVTGYSWGSGTSGDYATIKYNSAGVEQWVQRYNGPANSDDGANSITTDNLENVFVTGSSRGSGTGWDYATIKYNSAGVEQWVTRYNGPGNAVDGATSIAADNLGNVYVTGQSHVSGTNIDYTTIKYNSAGAEKWVQKYNGLGNADDYAMSMVIDSQKNIYVTGTSKGIGTSSDYATIKYSQNLQITITKPTSGDKFIAGEKDTIQWSGGQSGQLFLIDYSIDNGNTYNVMAIAIPADSGHFIWDIPDSILTTKAKIRITDWLDPNLSTTSSLFKIKPYVLTRLNDDSTYYAYKKDKDQWGFSNTPEDMWPAIWYIQFDYKGIDPFTTMQYSQIQGDSIFAKSSSSSHPDWVSWVNTFTVDSCYFSTVMGLYKPSALLKWEAQTGNWGGSCFGIAVANALAFRYKDQFQNKYPKFPSFINPITVVSDTGVKRVVNELFTHQRGDPHKTYRSNIGLEKTPKQTLVDLIEMFKEDNAQIRTLSFNNNGAGGGGHAILAYGLEKDSVNANLFYIKVYDNSHPNSNNRITINTSANGDSGSWVNPDWPGWGGNKWFYLRDSTVEYLTNPTMAKVVTKHSPFILYDNELEIYNTISASIQIRDNIGNLSGFYNNLILLDIPGSIPFIVDNGSETPPYGYSLPTDNYSVVLSEFAKDTVNTFFFTGNKSFLYERNGATQTQTDRLFFDGGVSVTNPDFQTKTVKLLNLINETTQEKLCVARSLDLAYNDSLKIENPDNNKIKLISYGTAKDYQIELNYATGEGLGRFVDFNIPLSANTSHTFVPNWMDITNTDLMVLVDIGNDGTIDDTLSLINQITGIGDDQGSLITPNNYNLAQNYPNPFNPVTSIKYSIKDAGLVKIKVYDILGSEVATLVNESKDAGNHSVQFNASHLPSGVYVYTLRTNNFVQTKKMLFLK